MSDTPPKPAEEKTPFAKLVEIITPFIVLGGLVSGIVAAFDNSKIMAVGSSFFTLLFLGTAIWVWTQKKFDGTKQARVSMYHAGYKVGAIALTLCFLGCAIHFWVLFKHEYEENNRLTAYVSTLTSTPISDVPGRPFVTMIADPRTGESYHLMPATLNFDVVKGEKPDFLKVEAVNVIVEKYEPLPRLLEMKEMRLFR